MTYPHQLPRFLHKAGASLYVSTARACDDALADGWVIDPNTEGPPTPAEPNPIMPPPERWVMPVKKGKHAR